MNMGPLNYRSSAVPGTVLLGRTKINPLYSLGRTNCPVFFSLRRTSSRMGRTNVRDRPIF